MLTFVIIPGISFCELVGNCINYSAAHECIRKYQITTLLIYTYDFE